MRSKCNLLLIILILIGCNPLKNRNSISLPLDSKNTIPNSNLQFWYHKDYQNDGIPGISLDKWHNHNKAKPELKSIIVAVLDTQIDLKHEDFQNQIWTNTSEIPDNGIDDDNNGYIDDTNGWSFVGTKSGAYLVWGNFEYTRLVREWQPIFKNKKEEEIPVRNLSDFAEYTRASKKLEKNNKFYKNWLKSLKHNVEVFPLVKDTLKHFFPKEDYTYKQLDSLYKICKINDKTYSQRRDDNDTDLGALIDYMMVNLEVNHKSLVDIQNIESQIDSVVNKNLNLDYDERILIGDNPKKLEKGYGNNKVSSTIKGIRSIQGHSTKVSGVIGANRENNKGIKGFSQYIKVMPLNISPSGDEHDKDIAMAIRYAVDNGAKVINMSFSKEFSLHKEWVSDALKYAEKNNVLVVHVASNDGFNSDENPIYPNDYNYDGLPEVCTNFINVGSVSHRMDSTFVSGFSNYGKQNVDLFAPGEDIYTTIAGGGYDFDSGTSLAGPMVSGTAALIWLYYPKLTASEVKQIILESGTAYDLEVIVPGTKDKKVHFSELSKSGKVLNVYNAMKLAQKWHKKKQ